MSRHRSCSTLRAVAPDWSTGERILEGWDAAVKNATSNQYERFTAGGGQADPGHPRAHCQVP